MSRALILMYHLIDEPKSDKEHRFCTPPSEFEQQMAYLARSGYTPLSLDQLLTCMDGATPYPPNPVHVTFDDGFVGVLSNALPILQRHNIPATLFALSGRLGETNDWMHARGFPSRPLLTGPQLRELAGSGVAIGSHTRTHPRLTELSIEEATCEIANSRVELELVLGQKVDYFAYPYGLYNTALRDAVAAAGYRAACSTLSGFNRPEQDRFLMRRIDVFGTDRLWQFRQKLRFGTNETSRLFPFRYYVSRVAARAGLCSKR